MKRIIVEAGSTCTKIHKQEENRIEEMPQLVIWFKIHYKELNQLDPKDIDILVHKINELKQECDDIYVCGTSIFRDLRAEERESFLQDFKTRTGVDFHIITSEMENILTVEGATKNVGQKAAVFIGGGGSTEISIYNNKIEEMVNSPFGVIDIMNKFPDLAEDLATTSVEQIKQIVKEKLKLPKQKADILILAGGAHKFFALNAGIRYESNTLYQDELQPIMMKMEERREDTNKYFTQISLDAIRRRVEDPKWWYATRAMMVVSLVVAEEIGAKYIVPTDISMVYGILEKEGRNKK